MMLYLSKRESMKKIGLILLGFLLIISLQAEEKINNIDKLDALDQQSKEFFKAITGLEKNYLEEQIQSIKNKKEEYQTEEGCLSLIGERKCKRYKEIEVEYMDINFNKQHGKYNGFIAEIIQHEIDHTNGIII